MTTNILVLCTHNSARSVLGETMINHWGKQLQVDVRGYSAGSTPSGRVNPFAIEVLEAAGISTEGVSSKNWDVFSQPDAPQMRLVITVCDSAAAEVCPFWPGSPVKAHWGYPDPSNAEGGDDKKRQAFDLTRQAIGYRVLQLLHLPFSEMSNEELQKAVHQIYSN